MSESLPVELNAGSVHAIDAPETFTARGPFHLELSNAGGAVHVHVHLSDDLSRAARLKEVNHYVESGETARVPVGTVSGAGEATGHLEIVTGYGAERKRIEVTITPAVGTDGRDDPQREHGDDYDDPGRERVNETPSEDSASVTRTLSMSTTGTSTAHPMERSATGMGVRGLTYRSLPNLPAWIDTHSREGLAFVVLAAVAMAIGFVVILTVGDLLLSFVVVVVVVAAVAAAGWLLLA